MLEFDVKPTHRVGVIGIGGLGHLAIKFLKPVGCEVTAFSSHFDKEFEARQFGARHGNQYPMIMIPWQNWPVHILYHINCKYNISTVTGIHT